MSDEPRPEDPSGSTTLEIQDIISVTAAPSLAPQADSDDE